MKKVAISAHKGGSEHARPATYEAYESSLDSGAEYVEFDIRKARDGVLLVFHNARESHTGAQIADLTYDELCAALGYAVPRVDKVMQLLAGKVYGHLDLKETGYESEVIELAAKFFGLENIVVTTLEDSSVAAIKQGFPEVRAALSLGRDLKDVPRKEWASTRARELFPLNRIRACNADWVSVNHQLARLGVLGMCARHGIGAVVWTVNSAALIDRFLSDQRVDVLATDRPVYAARRRDELARRR